MRNFDDLDLGATEEPEDRAEDLANRILDKFDLDVLNDRQFDTLCDVLDQVALTGGGRMRRTRSVTKVCRAVGHAKLPSQIKAALLLTLLNRDHFRPLRAQLATVAARDAGSSDGD